MEKTNTSEKIKAIQTLLIQQHINAWIIPSADPHLCEYVAKHWEERSYFSGFTGSAGTLVVTQKDAGLWTDSRYFLQAEQQLSGSGICLFKEGLSTTPSICQYLCNQLKANDCIGIDGQMFSYDEVSSLKTDLEKNDLQLKDFGDLPGSLWNDRPEIPASQAFIYDLTYAGKSLDEKLSKIREYMAAARADALFTSSLDEIAWTLNLRGDDIDYNPVNISYLLITLSEGHLFINEEKLSEEIVKYLKAQGISIHPYDKVAEFLEGKNFNRCMADTSKNNFFLISLIQKNHILIQSSSPITGLKAIRNEQEIEGIHQAMVTDGIALVRFLMWLQNYGPTGKETELSVEKKLHELRAESPLFKGESFRTIAGYKEHGAIVHYEADTESNSFLQNKGYILIDSGGQYLNGTTDITRTIALGELNEEEKRDYTLTLKGHISLARAIFPAGTRGTQLDVLARMPMWQERMNYLHGTGHGVGHFLNVHEGPQGIRMNDIPIALQLGMVTSNEPGIYKANKHGIRIENLVLVTDAGKGMFSDYYKFETLTLCPICTKGIIRELLSNEEIDWLNSYHEMVYQKLRTHLTGNEQIWLRKATLPI